MEIVQQRINLIEASLERLRARLPDLPINEVLILRLVLLLAHEFNLLLEHEIRPFGLGEGEFRVLTALFSQPEGIAHPSELCARASQSPANMSRISDALVRRDLITRGACAEDRRRMVLRITETGEDLVRNLLPTIFGPLRDIYRSHSADDQQQLIALLKRLEARVNEQLSDGDAEATA